MSVPQESGPATGTVRVLPETVKTHLAHIFRKLDAHNRAELTAHVLRRNPPD